MPSRTRWARSNRCVKRSTLESPREASSRSSRPSSGSGSARSLRARHERDSSSSAPACPSPSSTSRSTGPGRLWLGRPDMRWKKQRVLLEYQGREFHDSDEQRAQRRGALRRGSATTAGLSCPYGTTTSTPTPSRIALVLQRGGRARDTRSTSLDLNGDPSAVLQHPNARARRDPGATIAGPGPLTQRTDCSFDQGGRHGIHKVARGRIALSIGEASGRIGLSVGRGNWWQSLASWTAGR